MLDKDPASSLMGTRLGDSPTLAEPTAPDSETVPETEQYDERYDSDFTYLTKEKPASTEEGADENGVEPGADKPKPAPEGDKPKIDLPPIAQKPEAEKPAAPAKPADATVKPTDWEKRHNDLQSFHDKSLVDKDKEISTLKVELEQLSALKLVKEEVEKNPHAFLTKYYPELAEQLNPQKRVVEQLKKEFGAEFAAYDANEALQEGTTSFKIQQRLDELKNEAQRNRFESEVTRREESRKREELLTTSKNKVMKDYGLNEEQFKKEIIEFAKSMPASFETIAKIRYWDYHIQNAVTQALAQRKKDSAEPPPRSIAGVTGSDGHEESGSPAYKELSDVFGDM